MTKIEWTEHTWNFLHGCRKVSEGCRNCYALRMSWRLQHNPATAKQYAGTCEKSGGGMIKWTGRVAVIWERMRLPLQKKTPALWFVNSMSDLFHEDVPFEVVDHAMAVMACCPHHTFQVLTKRPIRMWHYFRQNRWMEISNLMMTYGGDVLSLASLPLPNLWLGVSVENQAAYDERVTLLLQVPAAVRFLSCEPLLGPILFAPDYREIRRPDWVIAGGESGPGSRPMHPEWARMIRDQCRQQKIPFFFKQWGEYSAGLVAANGDVEFFKTGKKKAGRLLDGKIYDEYPKQYQHDHAATYD